MAKNKRPVNVNSQRGGDTAELLNESSIRLMSEAVRLENVEGLSAVSRSVSREKAELADGVTPKQAKSGRRKKDNVSEAVGGGGSSVEAAENIPEKNSGRHGRKAEQGGSSAEKESSVGADKPINSSKAASTNEKGSGKTGQKGKGSPKKAVTDGAAEKMRKSKKTDAESGDQDDLSKNGSCKTRQVMKLIEGEDENLVVFAGKSRVPSLLRGRQSLSVMMRRNAAGTVDRDETEVVNITDLVIRHEAPEILDRFNACSCEKCVNVFSAMVAERIPVRYARISRAELESGELPERAVPMRQVVLPEMIRRLICNKRRCFHDE